VNFTMPKTILIVDDHASVRLYHQTFLSHQGYHCLSAADGTDALAKISQQAIDLVLLDMAMPGMNGRTFLAELAARPALARLPVLVITSDKGDSSQFADGTGRPIKVLCKPILPDKLFQHVLQLLAGAPVAAAGDLVGK